MAKRNRALRRNTQIVAERVSSPAGPSYSHIWDPVDPPEVRADSSPILGVGSTPEQPRSADSIRDESRRLRVNSTALEQYYQAAQRRAERTAARPGRLARDINNSSGSSTADIGGQNVRGSSGNSNDNRSGSSASVPISTSYSSNATSRGNAVTPTAGGRPTLETPTYSLNVPSHRNTATPTAGGRNTLQAPAHSVNAPSRGNAVTPAAGSRPAPFTLFVPSSDALSVFVQGLSLGVDRPPHPTPLEPPITETVAKPQEPPIIPKLAEDASILLELLGKASPNDDNATHRLLFSGAMENMLKIQQEYDKVDGKKSVGAEAEEAKGEVNTTVDSTCIICYDRIADIVLIPCSHLVLCSTCCETMGIKGKMPQGRLIVPCPICRMGVQDRIKIFRA